ncbi:MAG: PKD domain-containing protein, partial [bacterium]
MYIRKKLPAVCAILILTAAVVFITGCGGGGSSSVSNSDSKYNGPSGSLSFSFRVPRGATERASESAAEQYVNKVPSTTAYINISVTSTLVDKTISVEVPVEGGVAKATITGIPIGLNYVEIAALNASKVVVAHRVEAVYVTQDQTTPVSTVLGISITENGFQPSSFTINAGETVVWINNTSTPHSIELSENCKHDFQKRGVLFCTLTSAGTYPYADPSSSSFSGTITVEGTAPTSLLAADPSAVKTIGLPPLEVQFYGNATVIPSTAANITYSWDFGDGETSTDQNPIHTFANTGFYEVTLTVSDGTNSAAENINVVVQQAAALGALHTLVISPAAATLLPGETKQFTAVSYDENDNELDITPTWTVTGNIGTVTEAGLFTASAPGEGTVTATVDTLTASALVTVEKVECDTVADCDDSNALTLDE